MSLAAVLGAVAGDFTQHSLVLLHFVALMSPLRHHPFIFIDDFSFKGTHTQVAVFVYLSIYLFIFVCVFVYLSIYLSLYTYTNTYRYSSTLE